MPELPPTLRDAVLGAFALDDDALTADEVIGWTGGTVRDVLQTLDVLTAEGLLVQVEEDPAEVAAYGGLKGDVMWCLTPAGLDAVRG